MITLALRSLLKAPGFTAVAVLALALGIGANTAIFSVVYGLVLRPLPYPQQERLVFLNEWTDSFGDMSVGYPNFLDWRKRQKSFAAIGAARGQDFNYVGPAETERFNGAMASHDLFAALGVAPLRGRMFTAEEDRPGAERTVVLREGLWRRVFGGRDSVLGEKIELNGAVYTIVGVIPDAVRFPQTTTELWVPLGLFAEQYVRRDVHPGIYAVGRLRAGVTFTAAEAEMKGIAAQLATAHPDTNRSISIRARAFTEVAFGGIDRALYILLGAAGFVLLIACANVANLQLARAHARGREFAIRAALGASRARVIAQLLAESLVLGTLGCVAGVLLGVWGIDLLVQLLPAGTPRLDSVSLNGPVLLFSVAASLATSVVFGLIPAVHASRQDLRDSLAQGARTGGAAAGNRWRASLIVGEFALTCVLLVGAGLMIRTLANLYRSDPGYAVERTLVFDSVLPNPAYRDPARRRALFDRAIERLGAVQGVNQAALVSPLPLTPGGNQSGYTADGARPETVGRRMTEVFQASANLFSTLQIPLVAGRYLEPQDRETAPRVAVVDTLFVEKNFPGQDVVGKRFAFGGRASNEGDWIQIVGVVAHIQNYGPGQETREQVYLPYAQNTPAAVSFALRTTQDPVTLAATLRAVMREVAVDVPIFNVRTLDELFTSTISTQRLTVFLLGSFAALALVLAVVGLYGVLVYNVNQRTREIGVRMALGATPHSVVGLVLRHGLGLAALGLLLGLGASLALARLLQSVLFEVSSFDPLSFAVVAGFLTITGAAACWLPARRASRVDPMIALRSE